MTDFLQTALLVLAAFGLILLGWWLLIESEGVYLGRRVVVWLYDLYADRYDDIKHFRQEYDHMFLAQPIMELIAPHKAPLVLDVATGTGRLPVSMLLHAHFQGRVVSLDMSRRMLRKAAYKLDSPNVRAPLIHAPAEALPFPDNTFDVVTCLEALEFMENDAAVLREMVRVLRPGGLLLVTNRINTRLMPGKTRPAERMQEIIESMGVENVVLDYWQVDYDRVFGSKAGDSAPTGARPLAEVLRCPRCKQALLVEQERAWDCPSCGFHAPVGSDGVIELLTE
jgi:ubiquinone/menaquinone biosynthesis C-methylase UbiE